MNFANICATILSNKRSVINTERQYIAIDLKSFYASVECADRGIDPLDAFLVVADKSRTEKTICLAVSPALKAYGISGRARLFEVTERVSEINSARRTSAPDGKFSGKARFQSYLDGRPDLELDYIVAPPRMARYIEVSTQVYQVYLEHIAPEDIHIYSIDEVFIDATGYLRANRMTAAQLANEMIREVLARTGITATAGIGSNLFLCKVAMDIVAKHIKADKNGVRIAQLDEQSYRKMLWNHTPITDFWRVGRGTADKLSRFGMYTMGDGARCSLHNEELLYKLFGKNAELLIDHAWGTEPCTIAEIKAYRPKNTSLSSGQVLKEPYPFSKARLVMQEMAESLTLDLLSKKLCTDQIVLTVGYDKNNLKNGYTGESAADHYGRIVPKHTHGSENLNRFTSSAKDIVDAALRLFDRIVDRSLTVRRMTVAANTVYENEAKNRAEQLSLFSFENPEESRLREEQLRREREIQQTVLLLRQRYGKNAVIKGMNLKEGATAVERNGQIGGHRA